MGRQQCNVQWECWAGSGSCKRPPPMGLQGGAQLPSSPPWPLLQATVRPMVPDSTEATTPSTPTSPAPALRGRKGTSRTRNQRPSQPGLLHLVPEHIPPPLPPGRFQLAVPLLNCPTTLPASRLRASSAQGPPLANVGCAPLCRQELVQEWLDPVAALRAILSSHLALQLPCGLPTTLLALKHPPEECVCMHINNKCDIKGKGTWCSAHSRTPTKAVPF